MSNRIYTIRQLTKEFSVTARTLRFYEDEKLIAPGRRGQTRLYSARDRARIILILRGRRLGFSLAEIREVLDMYDGKDGEQAQMVHARKKFEERILVLERRSSTSIRRCASCGTGFATSMRRWKASPARLGRNSSIRRRFREGRSGPSP